ncbi:phenylalanine--tRNA ligase subunit alpha [Candidatus Falkowbacteria bacterium RIFOXYB2_FULL_34_18]|uniref:Phenylalanine--tRNA ligase alpha subunit n=1 Tax=Candidatus Falkowbacteria bacterium RIFOXYD2_FULL_34_120 TaxID=1798007 RepID=A0A1F5TRK6_9BACT|nr:MAG: phenylalanine--tRNA ligase subunit alpha [Candidatus Falkowbacteria bacterium RIFOXYB2_FULL_34_18]OGF29920.1 MAG: phenylalanine--tRNA ligase subunit alpha [Candidatus Falkowbacteria bacterium RIFOXYC12_FULL_34_55]OGF37222.1 MAG: phenylalanine--tRNA ligase subunit alpha [Candidatus Falkowbacteria bacterium RIFOXYC2_FULL_34_220]OGF39458.1 MAG: phenylalanine--tRNA ligase subunit alpha [Candidatus Falkowbacteria bacterium RIFOXYD12_FULL_34_57]OGF41560.1 MAG: phenylalanine--tRNA ligase subun
MQNKIIKLKEEFLDKLENIGSEDDLKSLEVEYLGRKGKLTQILRGLSGLSLEDKKKIGKLSNDVKRELEDKNKEAMEKIMQNSLNDFVDVTLPGKKITKGHIHPITRIQNELEDLFIAMGFMVLDGPELESDFYCFEALNILKNHPARDMQDTFYIDPASIKNSKGSFDKNGEYDMVMRTHTSPVQVRAMQKYGAPLRAIVPGRCFRNEATDVRHEHTLYQIEGLMIDRDINFSHLKAMLEIVGKKLYGEDTRLRMRPKFYPFVEPGSNGEYTCFICRGRGCKLCKYSGWLEILGCGMIHPNVLRNGGIDPEKYSGFAFGFGLSRLAQLKYGIDDTRLFMSGDMRFLEQF